VFALQPTGACDVGGRAERLSDEMACLAVLGCVPVLGLVLEFHHRCLPPKTRSTPESTGTNRRGIGHLHTFMLSALAPRVMTFVHLKIREWTPVTFFAVIAPDRLVIGTDALGMAICPLSLMTWGVLPPSAPGAPRSRDRSVSAVRE
jgi:hypothetical protein